MIRKLLTSLKEAYGDHKVISPKIPQLADPTIEITLLVGVLLLEYKGEEAPPHHREFMRSSAEMALCWVDSLRWVAPPEILWQFKNDYVLGFIISRDPSIYRGVLLTGLGQLGQRFTCNSGVSMESAR